MANFLGNNVVFQFRISGTTAIWRTLICETSLNGELTNDVNTVITKCGQIKAAGIPGATISGSGTWDSAPTSAQATYAELLDLCNAVTLMEGRMINLVSTSPSVATGAAVLIKGSGYFTSVKPTANAGESLVYDWTFEITGTVDTTEAGES